MTTIGGLLERYAEAAIRHKEGLTSGDYKRTNRAADALGKIAADLDAHGDAGKQALAELMTHESMAVRCSAARDSLFLVDQEEKARAVLKEISREEGMIGFDAEMVLEVWDKGELHDPWPSTQANCNCPACRQARSQGVRQ